MKALHIGISTVVLLSLAGCGTYGTGKRIDYRAGAEQAPALEIPPGLTAPGSDDRYKVPQGEGVTTYSDYSRSGEPTQARASVLPSVKGVRLERNGTQRWLVVEDQPENVWPVVKAFWQENGLGIASEDQAAGVMETVWAENRANIPMSGIRNVVGKVFDNLYSSGEKDQYLTRLERSKDGTGIYITHRGMEEVVSADGNTSKWQARANDPELEAIMLQKLMARFGGDAKAAEAKAAPADGGAASPAMVAGDGKASLQEVFDGSKVIVVNDAFDKTWRRVGLAIERAGLAVEDKDRARGVYFLGKPKEERGWLDSLKFWEDDTSDRRYRVIVKDGGASCEVMVADQDGAIDQAGQQLIETIYKHIGE